MSTTTNVIHIRNQGIHISSLMLLMIISNVDGKTGSAYLGEIHAYYHEHRKTGKNLKSYTEGGIRAHLTVMSNKGLLKKRRDGLCVSYSVTSKGKQIIKELNWNA